MLIPDGEPETGGGIAKRLVDLVGKKNAIDLILAVAPGEPWIPGRPHVTWAAFQRAVDALEVASRKHGAAWDLLLPNTAGTLFQARDLLKRRALDPTLGASVVWHAQSLVQLWCFVEQLALRGKNKTTILRDAAKCGYSVRVMVSSPRPRASAGKSIQSFLALQKAYEQADKLLKSVPEAHGYFRASVDAFHEVPDRGDAYHKQLHKKLVAAGLVSSLRPGAHADQHDHWMKQLEARRRAEVVRAKRSTRAKAPSRSK
jgi:hypothetical protein